MQVERGIQQWIPSGERVSNALVTCPKERDNSPKGLLIPHVVIRVRDLIIKGSNPLWEGPASHQLVGRVMAYQGDDG
jgi:hypothetical protein